MTKLELAEKEIERLEREGQPKVGYFTVYRDYLPDEIMICWEAEREEWDGGSFYGDEPWVEWGGDDIINAITDPNDLVSSGMDSDSETVKQWAIVPA